MPPVEHIAPCSFLRKNLHGNIFSAEKGNLYAKHSYKYSGAQAARVACAVCLLRPRQGAGFRVAGH